MRQVARQEGTMMHKDGTLPPDTQNWVFVFGSNFQGIHGAGAAQVARLLFGAVPGCGRGPTGRAYAIPTKLSPHGPARALQDIERDVAAFLEYARARSDLQFWVTAIGCGLAGYTHNQVMPMFAGAPLNCNLPEALGWISGYTEAGGTTSAAR